MSANAPLTPAAELVKLNRMRMPNESAEYRRARQELLMEEIELRRHIERVAELRRALPPGGEVTKNTNSRARAARSRWRTCSATSRRCLSTATCLVRSAKGRARYARRSWVH